MLAGSSWTTAVLWIIASSPPCIVGVELRMAVQRWTWKHVATKLGEPSFANGGFLEGALDVLRPTRSSFGLQTSLISIITGAIPTLAQVREIQVGRSGPWIATRFARFAFRTLARRTGTCDGSVT